MVFVTYVFEIPHHVKLLKMILGALLYPEADIFKKLVIRGISVKFMFLHINSCAASSAKTITT